MLDVSVIVCCFNEELFLERCLRSILSQKTQFNFEVIVVDDASTDNSLSIVERYSDKVTIIKNKTNLGIGATANLGIRNSRGRFVVRVDGDDYVSQHFIEVLTVGLKELNAHAVECDYSIVGDDDSILGKGSPLLNPIACGILFKKDLLVSVGLYDDNQKIYEEIELRERFEKLYCIKHIGIPLYRYRAHDNNTTGLVKVFGHRI